MKKVVALLTLLIIGFSLQAQNQDAYIKAMSQGLQTMGTAQSIEDMQNAAGQFERIAAKVADQWHPAYYASLNYINIAMQAEGVSTKDQYLEKAQALLDKASKIDGNNSEIVTLQGYIYMAQLTADPNSRGQTLSPKVMQAFGEAMKIEPKNPRAMALMAQMQYGTAEFFGSPTANACELGKKSLPLFEAEAKGQSFEPTWGIQVAQDLKSKCGN